MNTGDWKPLSSVLTWLGQSNNLLILIASGASTCLQRGGSNRLSWTPETCPVARHISPCASIKRRFESPDSDEVVTVTLSTNGWVDIECRLGGCLFNGRRAIVQCQDDCIRGSATCVIRDFHTDDKRARILSIQNQKRTCLPCTPLVGQIGLQRSEECERITGTAKEVRSQIHVWHADSFNPKHVL